MNTPYLYICEIPGDVKPVLLLAELRNKFARMLYLESDLAEGGRRAALVYCPCEDRSLLMRGVDAIRCRGNGIQVYFVWFPPVNVLVATMIPAGASMLSYIFVENLHKDVIPTEVIYDLPLQMSDIKTWDIAERQDKCIVIKLPHTCNPAMRSFILGTLRNRPVRGMAVFASELIISEDCQLSSQMVPRTIKMVEMKKESYLSHFLYMHDIPSILTVKMLVETPKTDNIRGSRVFFVETNKNMKYGFMYVPRSLPNGRFVALHKKLQETEFPLSNNSVGRVKINQTWFRPIGADLPQAKDGEMILTEYLYLTGVPQYIQPSQLIMGCPWQIKLYLFTVNEISTQIGFVVLRGLNEQQVTVITEYLRNLDFNGERIQVEEVYIHCHDLPDDIDARPFQFQQRISAIKKNDSMKRTLNTNGFSNTVVLSNALEYDSSLMKSDFICVDYLPKNVSKAALIFDIGEISDGCIIIPRSNYCTAFIYFPECNIDAWKSIMKKLSLKKFGTTKEQSVCEVYLKTDFNDVPENNHFEQDFEDSNIVFVYNIAREVSNIEVCQLGPDLIEYSEILETTTGSKSAFILLGEDSTQEDKLAFLYDIRKKFLRNKPVYADLLKLAKIRLVPVDNDISKRLKY